MKKRQQKMIQYGRNTHKLWSRNSSSLVKLESNRCKSSWRIFTNFTEDKSHHKAEETIAFIIVYIYIYFWLFIYLVFIVVVEIVAWIIRHVVGLSYEWEEYLTWSRHTMACVNQCIWITYNHINKKKKHTHTHSTACIFIPSSSEPSQKISHPDSCSFRGKIHSQSIRLLMYSTLVARLHRKMDLA